MDYLFLVSIITSMLDIEREILAFKAWIIDLDYPILISFPNLFSFQDIEREIQDFKAWITDMDYLIQSRLDADVLAQDVPEEYDQMQAEFEHQEELLADLEKQVEAYRVDGKLEAANRLEQQIGTNIKKGCSS